MFTQNTYSILIVHRILLILLLLSILLFSTANALIQDSFHFSLDLYNS